MARRLGVGPVFFCVALARAATTQVSLEWVTPVTPAPPGTTVPFDLAVDSAGDIYGAGATGGPTTDGFVSKWSASGALLWRQLYGGTVGSDQAFYALVLDPAGGVLAAGHTRVVGNLNALVAKYSADGALLWATHYAGPSGGDDSFRALAVDAQGDAYAVGSAGAGSEYDVLAVKLSAAGAIVWTRTIGDSGIDYAADVIVDPGGAMYVGGSVATGTWISSSHVARLDPGSGSVIWSATFEPDSLAQHAVVSLALDPTGALYVAGRSFSTATADWNGAIHVVKFDPSGTQAWSSVQFSPVPHAIGGPSSIRFVAPNLLAVVGQLGVLSSLHSDFVTSVWDVDGSLQWTSSFNGDGASWDFGIDVFADDDGDLVSIGSSGFERSLVVRCHETRGLHKWTRTLSGAVLADAADVSVAARSRNGRIVIAGPRMSGSCFAASLAQRANKLCHGDGSGSACPCGNHSQSIDPSGCTSSLGVGSELNETGVASVSSDTLVLRGTAMPNSSATYFQGTRALGGGSGVAFGDGLQCAGGTAIRLGTKTNAGGASSYPAAGDPSVSIAGVVSASSVRIYQIWYRNDASFCTPSTFNLTNGLSVDWEP